MRPSEGLISLGTSDVVLVSTKNYAPDKEYHAFFHPAQIPPDQGGRGFSYFNMLVYKSEQWHPTKAGYIVADLPSRWLTGSRVGA